MMPGAFVVIQGLGVLILGKSGVGKSDCVLELISRGHIFVADDCVRLKKINSHHILGLNPAKSGFPAHIRGLGILDIEKIFGPKHVKKSCPIDLVVKLEKWQKKKLYLDVKIKNTSHEILGVKFPSLSLPLSSTRSVATLIETAARCFKNGLTRTQKTALECTLQE